MEKFCFYYLFVPLLNVINSSDLIMILKPALSQNLIERGGKGYFLWRMLLFSICIDDQMWKMPCIESVDGGEFYVF